MKILLLISMLLLTSLANAAVIPTTFNGLTDSGDELWTLTDANSNYDDSGFEMLFSRGSFNSSDHEFGFYQYDAASDSIASMLAIFDSSADAGDSTNLVWDLGNLSSGESGATVLGGTSSAWGSESVSAGHRPSPLKMTSAL